MLHTGRRSPGQSGGFSPTQPRARTCTRREVRATRRDYCFMSGRFTAHRSNTNSPRRLRRRGDGPGLRPSVTEGTGEGGDAETWRISCSHRPPERAGEAPPRERRQPWRTPNQPAVMDEEPESCIGAGLRHRSRREGAAELDGDNCLSAGRFGKLWATLCWLWG